MTDVFSPSFLILALGLIGLGVLFLGIAVNTLVGLLAFFIVDYLLPQNIGPPSVRLLVLIAILALTLFVSFTKEGVAFTSGRRNRAPLPRALLVMVALFVAVILASSYEVMRRPGFWSLSTQASEYVARHVLLALTTSLLLVITVVQVVHTRERLDKLMRALVLLAVIMAVYGLVQYVTGVKFLAGLRLEDQQRWRLTSITSGTHAHTYYLVLPALYVTYSWLLGSRRGHYGWLGVGALLVVTLVLSMTRAVFVGMALSGIVFFIISPLNRALKQAAAVAAVGLLVAVFVLGFRLTSTEPDALNNSLLGAVVAPGSENTYTFWSPFNIDNIWGRAGTWSLATMAMGDKPVLGYGVGMSTRVVGELTRMFSRGGSPGRSLHSTYLDWAVDTGLVGGAVLALMLLLTIYKLYAVMRRAQRLRDHALATYACAFLAILPVFMVMDFFSNDTGMQPLFLFFALSLVLERLLAKESRRQPETARPALAATPARA